MHEYSLLSVSDVICTHIFSAEHLVLYKPSVGSSEFPSKLPRVKNKQHFYPAVARDTQEPQQ